jgi:hypothetical protein
MNRFVKAICTIAVIIFAPAALACDYPTSIDVPNGKEATKEEMMAGVKAMKAWQEELIIYRECIEEENEASKAAIDSSDPLDQIAQAAALDRQLLLKYNASVDEETELGSEVNEQIRVYNSKKKKD